MQNLIHPTAIIDPAAKLGKNVGVGPFSFIGAGVELGDNTVVQGWCEIGKPYGTHDRLVVGADSLIRSHCVFYLGSTFGDGLVTGHHVTVLAGVTAGRSFQIGSYGDVQGPASIGDYVSFQSKVFVAPKTVIKDFCWVFINVVLTNDPTPPSYDTHGVTLEAFSVVAAGSVILPGVRVGERAVVAAGSLVSRDVADDMLVSGNPARVRCRASDVTLRDGSGQPAYPWTRHYRKKYPQDITVHWPE